MSGIRVNSGHFSRLLRPSVVIGRSKMVSPSAALDFSLMIDSTLAPGTAPVVFTYTYERVGAGMWRKGSSPSIHPVADHPGPSPILEHVRDQVLVHVYNACPHVGTELSRESDARSLADDVLRRRFRGCTILNPFEGRG